MTRAMSGESWTEIGPGVRMGVSVLEEKFLSACARKDCLSVSLGLSKDLESETFPVNGDIRYKPDQCLHGAAGKGHREDGEEGRK